MNFPHRKEIPTPRIVPEDFGQARAITTLEQEIADEIDDLRENRLPPMPDYVDHAEDVDAVGRLTSEALVMTYEASAQKLEEMGATLLKELKETEVQTVRMVQELERIRTETQEAVDQCKYAAQVYRDQAKQVFEQIQRRSIIANKARQTCDSLVKEIKDA